MEENEVVKDYRSGKMDPASEVSKFEKFRHNRGMNGRKNISDVII